jgi:hypothetical protein
MTETIVLEMIITEPITTKVNPGTIEKGTMKEEGSRIIGKTIEEGEREAGAKLVMPHKKTSPKFTP